LWLSGQRVVKIKDIGGTVVEELPKIPELDKETLYNVLIGLRQCLLIIHRIAKMRLCHYEFY